MNIKVFRRLFWSAHLLGFLFLALFYAACLLYAEAVPSPSCLFLRFFRLYCPGCGGTRAVSALLSGRLWRSFLYFPPLWVGIFLCVDAEVRAVRSYLTGDLRYLRSFRAQKLIWLAAAVLLWFVLRNALYFLCGFDPLGDLTAWRGR